MFERYTEKARRVIFFARYEASQYGSHYIETEHLLLGLLRENGGLIRSANNENNPEPEIRDEIEKRIVRSERFSTSVEVPLSKDSKQALKIASETAERLNHRWIDPGHLLVGMSEVNTAIAAQILIARGLTADALRVQIAKEPRTPYHTSAVAGGLLSLNAFVAGLKSLKADDLIPFFAKNAEFIDTAGKRWNHEEIGKTFDELFAPYAKKNATYAIESTIVNTNEVFVVIVLWKNALLASEQRAWLHRMTVVLAAKGDDWEIVLIQVTVALPS